MVFGKEGVFNRGHVILLIKGGARLCTCLFFLDPESGRIYAYRGIISVV